MGSGTDVARESADVILIGSDLSKLVETLRVARHCRDIITQNFVGTLVVDSIGVGMAAFGFLNPGCCPGVPNFRFPRCSGRQGRLWTSLPFDPRYYTRCVQQREGAYELIAYGKVKRKCCRWSSKPAGRQRDRHAHNCHTSLIIRPTRVRGIPVVFHPGQKWCRHSNPERPS
jgi:hypothetical protein